MAEFYKGTLLASPIVRGSSGDTYGTHHSVLGVGGFMEFKTIAERNSLPIDDVNGIGYDGISSGQRRLGMLVYVYDEDTIYKLKIDQTSWSGFNNAQKLAALGDNNNWEIFFTGADTNGESIERSFTQTTHGFVIGDVIGYDGLEFVKVSSITANIIEPLGLVSEVVDVDTFKITFSGYVSTSGVLDVDTNALVGGTKYYLSSTAGKISVVEPTVQGEISKPILVSLPNDHSLVLQYRGFGNEFVTQDEFTGFTSTIGDIVSGASNSGYFTGLTGIQTLPITHLVSSEFNGNYDSLYNNFYRDDSGYVRIGIASDDVPRRGYYSSEIDKSWIWNEYSGDGANTGWILVNGNVNSDVVYDELFTGNTNIKFSTPHYTDDVWNEGQSYNNGSLIVIGQVVGDVTTGNSLTIGGPIFKDKVDNELQLRTIISTTPETIDVSYDDYYIKLSAGTSISGAKSTIPFAGGASIISGVSGNTLITKQIVGDGDTTVTENDDHIVISSVASGSSSTSGKVVKKITQPSHGFVVGEFVGWSGGTYNRAIADGIYDGEFIGLVSKINDSNNFEVTQSGYLTELSGLAQNLTYYLSDTTNGLITSTAPTTIGHVNKAVLVADSTSSGWVLPYPGIVIASGGTSGGGGNELYTGRTPSNITVGGIDAGSTLTGKTYTELFEELLITVFDPTFVNPSNTFSSPQTGTYEVGEILDITFNGSFNRGSINLEGSFQNYRSGDPNAYNYGGTDLNIVIPTNSMSDIRTVNNYVMLENANSWTSNVSYDLGPQPLNSEGNNFGTPLPAGSTSDKTVTLTGRYYRFFGPTSTTPTNSGEVRNLPDQAFQTSNSNTFILNTGSASTKFVVALPPSRTISTVFDLDALNANITSEYVNIGTISVNDGGGTGTARIYNLYEMNLGSSYSSSHRHEIKTA